MRTRSSASPWRRTPRTRQDCPRPRKPWPRQQATPASNCSACTATSARRSSNPTASPWPRRNSWASWPRCRQKYSIRLPELDLGGGYGIAYTPVDTPRPAAEIAQAMAAVVRSKCAELGITAPRISIEPGRAIVGSSTFTLYEVGTLKTVRVDAPADGDGRNSRRQRQKTLRTPAAMCRWTAA